MTDALRDAEAAARGRLLVMPDALDAYRDAIEKRVREERDVEVRVLVEACRAQVLGDNYGSHEAICPIDFEEGNDCACWLRDIARALKPFEEAQP